MYVKDSTHRAATTICCLRFFFFFNDTATTEIYTLSLHDALPILSAVRRCWGSLWTARAIAYRAGHGLEPDAVSLAVVVQQDRKSTRLNSSHANISYAVFCLKKKKYSGCLMERGASTWTITPLAYR